MRVFHPENESVQRLWSLVYAQTQIDPAKLNNAIEEVIKTNPESELDQRTRKLLFDAVEAMRRHPVYHDRLSPAVQSAVAKLFIDPLGFIDRGFHDLGKRLMSETTNETIEKVLRLIDRELRNDLRIYIAGSGSLILQQIMSRNTEDIDIVNEVPAELRNNHKLLSEISDRYQIQIGHVQSHYLPSGWEVRAKNFGDFNRLQVYVVDALDIFIGKLFSKRLKDQQHLDVLAKRFDRVAIRKRFLESANDLMADEFSRPNAEKNWYVLFGEKLPVASDNV